MSAADRSRRYRKRKRADLAVFSVEVPRGEAADALVELGWLEGWDADDPAAIEKALTACLRHLIRHA